MAVNCTNLALKLEDNTSAFHQRFFQILQMTLHQVYLLHGILMGIFRFWPLINRIQGTGSTEKTYTYLHILCVNKVWIFWKYTIVYIYLYIYMPQFLRKYFWFTDICFKIHVSFFSPSLSRLNFTALPFRQLSCKACRPHCLPVELCTF